MNKVDRINVPLGRIVLYLEKSHLRPGTYEYQALFTLEGTDNRQVPIRTWYSENHAKKCFREIVRQIEQGKYRLRIYSNGNAELDLFQQRNPLQKLIQSLFQYSPFPKHRKA